MKEFVFRMFILTASWSVQYSKCLLLDASLWNPCMQFQQKCPLLLLLLPSNQLRFLMVM